MLRKSHSFSSLQKIGQNDQEDCEEDDGSVVTEYEKHDSYYSILRWPKVKVKGKKPVVNFVAACVLIGTPDECLQEIKKYRLGYKFVKTECKLVRNILAAHGFKETPQNSVQYNIMWTGTHLKPYALRSLTEFQKVNHFPRSYELTRKDRLYKNIQRMQHAKGVRNFDFTPHSFVLPAELNDFYSVFLKDRGPWIVKPCASSRGRGIYLINHTNQIPLDENVLVCRYIDNPLLINGYKFDCRIYVAVTSYDPLRIYIYEEGLARFSTVKYEKGAAKNLQNQWMHLTNYSLNKYNEDYIRCEDPEIDDYGSKWSFSAMIRCLKVSGKDTRVLMAKIEDVIIKTIISGEMAIATACKMFVPFHGNCFELFGFDILIDENLKPWLLEVNLSPSLACDTPMDLKIKANLITDLFNLTGIAADNPTVRKPAKLLADAKKKQRHASSSYSSSDLKSITTKALSKPKDTLTSEERKLLWETKEEFHRRGYFIRVYPSPESWELYSSLQDHQTSHNRMIHSKLYPELWSTSQRPQSAIYIARARNISVINKPVFTPNATDIGKEEQNFHLRYLQYERKLEHWSTFGDKPCVGNEETSEKPCLVQGELNFEEQQARYKYEEKLLNARVSPTQQKFETIPIQEVVRNGKHLSKLQAREAFAVYLQRVQHRLLQEISLSRGNLSYDRLTAEELEKQENQMHLIHKFLLKASSNLSTSINIIIPHEDLPVLDRKKILARQLNDFIRVYRRETDLLCARNEENSDTKQDSIYNVPEDSFNTFVAIANETELEEILTIYTQHNKSASIFLGAKSVKKDTGSTRNTRVNDQPHNGKPSTPSEKSSEVLHRPKYDKSTLRKNSADSNLQNTSSWKRRPPSERHERHTSEPNKSFSKGGHTRNMTDSKLRTYLAVDADILESKKAARQLSADVIQRVGSGKMSSSSGRFGQMSNAICAYTGSNDLLKYHKQKQYVSDRRSQSRVLFRPDSSYSAGTHVYGVDNPQLKNALKEISERQSNRMYSANYTDHITPGRRRTKSFENEKTISRPSRERRTPTTSDSKYQEFLDANCKNFELDNSDYDIYGPDERTLSHHAYHAIKHNTKSNTAFHDRYESETSGQISSDNSERPVIYNQPRPPRGKRPEIKKKLNSQRMSRIVGRK